MQRLTWLIGRRINFYFHNLRCSGNFLGLGKDKKSKSIGLIFSNVVECGIPINSIMMVDPHNMESSYDNVSKFAVKKFKEIFNCYTKTPQKTYYTPSQIKQMSHKTEEILEKVPA